MNLLSGRSEEFILACFLLVFVISNICPGCVSDGSDTLSTGQSLSQNQTIISRGGKFELGFFNPGTSNNSYVGIWYKKITVRTVVWVANRNNPIRFSFNPSQLEMSNGSLNLIVNSERIWMIAGSSNASEAVILDSGNLVLRNASGIIWQSFDYPTDTWLPGGMIGFRWSSDIEAKLVSWRNDNNPGTGNYSLGLEPSGGSELFLKDKSSIRTWRSGLLQGGSFAFAFASRGTLYNFSYVTKDDMMYLTYNVYNESIMVRMVLGVHGVISLFVWLDNRQNWVIYASQPNNYCGTYALCGANAICDINLAPPCRCLDGYVPRIKDDWDLFDFSGGCVRMRPLKCVEDRIQFLKFSQIILPANPESVEIRRNGVCQFLCIDNCSCNAYALDITGGCLLFMGDLLDLKLASNFLGTDLYVKTQLPGHGKRNVLVVAIAMPVTAAILVSCFSIFFRRRKLKRKAVHQNLLLLDLNSSVQAYGKRASVRHGREEDKNNQYELPIFSLSSISTSTNSFAITNKLGEGGFGPVYKGELLNGQFVAVKRLSRRSGQGLEEFKTETELIAKLQHRNLVGILGCCIEKDEKILVYEYMPNKSLDFFLFEPTRKELLDWGKRVHIIDGIAQGLVYLHHHSRLRIVHRDLKASNILLDVEMNPKISDFGMARIFGGSDMQANTKRIVGTYGYMSPEYAMEGRFSVKSDVFAFGVLMLEIISGKKNTGFYGSEYLSLLGYAWNLWNHERLVDLIDPTIEIPESSSCIPLRYIQIGLLCVQESPVDRPLMSEVIAMLNNEQTSVASPKHPAFTVARTLVQACPGEARLCSINDLTVSDMEAR